MTDLGKPQPADRPGGFRVLALVAVSTGLLLLAAAAFVLSYTGVHAVALSAGVTPRLARLYPPIFDAMLVIACAAILSLRGAGLPSRFYAWLSLILLLVAVASANALHATNTALPHRPAAATAAVIPWALVLIGFGLLVTMLRHGRLRRAAQTALEDQPIRRGGLAALGFAPEPPALPAGSGTESDSRRGLGFQAYSATEPGLGAVDDYEPGFETAGDDPGSETAGDGGSGSETADDHEPGPGTAGDDESESGTADDYEPGSGTAGDDEPGSETVDDYEPGSGTAGVDESGSGTSEEPEAVSQSVAAAGDEPVPGPQVAPVQGTAPQFERVRSLPVPPEN